MFLYYNITIKMLRYKWKLMRLIATSKTCLIKKTTMINDISLRSWVTNLRKQKNDETRMTKNCMRSF